MTESRLDFVFKGEAVKFDETEFYMLFKSYQPNGKGVDFLSQTEDTFIFLEVKNCTGYEKENIWRTKKDNLRDGEESFDIEMAKKVEGTIACLVGAGVSSDYEKSNELKPYYEGLNAPKIARGKKNIQVILFLEGEFGSKTRNKKMIMKRIKDSIQEKLKWLNCTVRVVDLDTYRKQLYRVHKIKD